MTGEPVGESPTHPLPSPSPPSSLSLCFLIRSLPPRPRCGRSGADPEMAASAPPPGPDPLEAALEAAHGLKAASPAQAVEAYRRILLGEPRLDVEAIKVGKGAPVSLPGVRACARERRAGGRLGRRAEGPKPADPAFGDRSTADAAPPFSLSRIPPPSLSSPILWRAPSRSRSRPSKDCAHRWYRRGAPRPSRRSSSPTSGPSSWRSPRHGPLVAPSLRALLLLRARGRGERPTRPQPLFPTGTPTAHPLS